MAVKDIASCYRDGDFESELYRSCQVSRVAKTFIILLHIKLSVYLWYISRIRSLSGSPSSEEVFCVTHPSALRNPMSWFYEALRVSFWMSGMGQASRIAATSHHSELHFDLGHCIQFSVMSDSAPAMAPTKHLEPIGETFLEKAKRKTIEEPLVPVG